MGLPLYRSSISENDNDEVEVDFIALVKNPAIEKNFLAFDNNRQSFAIESEEERIITGLAMVADLPIYRRDNSGEYFTYFDADSIKKIALRFFRKKYNFNLNLNHDANYKVEDVYIFESWIVDRSKGKAPMSQFSDVADGSWIISAKIDNPEIWDAVKRGEFKGFSVEGLFKMERVEYKKDEEIDEDFLNELKEVLQHVKL
jgi:hypothetical protein